jgi:hypothetical protein
MRNILEKIYNWNVGPAPSFMIYFVVFCVLAMLTETAGFNVLGLYLYALSVLSVVLGVSWSFIRKK